MPIRSVAGIVVGAIVDVSSSTILGVLLIFSLFPATRTSPDAYAATVMQPAVFAGLFMVGSACSAAGGYVAAWIAREREMLNALFSSFLCIGLAIVSMFSGDSPVPVWLEILLLPTSPAFSIVGGYVRRRQKHG